MVHSGSRKPSVALINLASFFFHERLVVDRSYGKQWHRTRLHVYSNSHGQPHS